MCVIIMLLQVWLWGDETQLQRSEVVKVQWLEDYGGPKITNHLVISLLKNQDYPF